MNEKLQWIIAGVIGLIILRTVFKFFFGKKMQPAMSPAAQGDMRNIGAEGKEESKWLNLLNRAKSKKERQELAKKLEGATKEKLGTEQRLEGDLRK